MEKEKYELQKKAIEADIKNIYNLKWTVVDWRDGVALIFKSIHVNNKLDEEQIQGLINLMNYGFEKFYVQPDEENEIIIKMW